MDVVSSREPQSVQSVPRSQTLNFEPGPPSSQSPSAGNLHVFVHSVVVAPLVSELSLGLLVLEPASLALLVVATSSLELVKPAALVVLAPS